LLGDRQSIVDLDPEIANRAFDLCVAKQELNGTQVARPPVVRVAFVRRRE
jgi:hypothetical protein